MGEGNVPYPSYFNSGRRGPQAYQSDKKWPPQEKVSNHIHSLAISCVTSTMWPRRKIKQDFHFSILCLTRDFIRQGHAREKSTAQPIRAARRSIEGNGRGEAVTSRRYGNCLTASKQSACTAQPVRAARRLIEGITSQA